MLPFVVCLIIACLLPQALFADEPDTSVASPRVKQAAEWIELWKQAEGIAPNDLDFATFVLELKLPQPEFQQCWKILNDSQQPVVSKSDLLELYKIKRSSIRTLRYKYTLKADALVSGIDPRAVWQTDCVFVRSGGSLRLDCSEWTQERGRVESTTAYDGNAVRSVALSHNPKSASIRQFAGVADYYRSYDLLASTMLLNSEVELQQQMGVAWDLVAFLNLDSVMVLQKLEEFDGRKCVTVANAIFRASLDVDRDFSVLRFEGAGFEMEDVGSQSVVSKYRRRNDRKLTELTDYGNGIWLPQRVESTTFGIKEELRSVLVASEIALNQDVSNSVFEDIIPDGALVNDSIRNLSYVFGKEPSIEGALDSATIKTQQNKPWLIIANVVAVLILLTWVWSRRRFRSPTISGG